MPHGESNTDVPSRAHNYSPYPGICVVNTFSHKETSHSVIGWNYNFNI
jgi:hypothetical protein